MRKGLLELCILNALVGRERYDLSATSGLGVTERTLYPLLSRLRVQGLVQTRQVESSKGPARRYYSLTPEGRRNLRLMNTYLEQLVKGCREIRDIGDRTWPTGLRKPTRILRPV